MKSVEEVIREELNLGDGNYYCLSNKYDLMLGEKRVEMTGYEMLAFLLNSLELNAHFQSNDRFKDAFEKLKEELSNIIKEHPYLTEFSFMNLYISSYVAFYLYSEGEDISLYDIARNSNIEENVIRVLGKNGKVFEGELFYFDNREMSNLKKFISTEGVVIRGDRLRLTKESYSYAVGLNFSNILTYMLKNEEKENPSEARDYFTSKMLLNMVLDDLEEKGKISKEYARLILEEVDKFEIYSFQLGANINDISHAILTLSDSILEGNPIKKFVEWREVVSRKNLELYGKKNGGISKLSEKQKRAIALLPFPSIKDTDVFSRMISYANKFDNFLLRSTGKKELFSSIILGEAELPENYVKFLSQKGYDKREASLLFSKWIINLYLRKVYGEGEIDSLDFQVEFAKFIQNVPSKKELHEKVGELYEYFYGRIRNASGDPLLLTKNTPGNMLKNDEELTDLALLYYLSENIFIDYPFALRIADITLPKMEPFVHFSNDFHMGSFFEVVDVISYVKDEIFIFDNLALDKEDVDYLYQILGGEEEIGKNDKLEWISENLVGGFISKNDLKRYSYMKVGDKLEEKRGNLKLIVERKSNYLYKIEILRDGNLCWKGNMSIFSPFELSLIKSIFEKLYGISLDVGNEPLRTFKNNIYVGGESGINSSEVLYGLEARFSRFFYSEMLKSFIHFNMGIKNVFYYDGMGLYPYVGGETKKVLDIGKIRVVFDANVLYTNREGQGSPFGKAGFSFVISNICVGIYLSNPLSLKNPGLLALFEIGYDKDRDGNIEGGVGIELSFKKFAKQLYSPFKFGYLIIGGRRITSTLSLLLLFTERNMKKIISLMNSLFKKDKKLEEIEEMAKKQAGKN